MDFGSGKRQRIAVIGSGVSGLTAAYILRTAYDVVLFESDDRFGGHAHTHAVHDGDDTHHVDSGFIVHNDRTYPYLRRLFDELDVQVQPTEMSMSIHCEGCGLEYAGGRGLSGLFAQRRRVFDPRYLRMLLSVKRFQRLALALLDSDENGPRTYGDFLHEHGFSDYFISHYAIPVVSCVWSSGSETALEYPSRYLFEFLKHHGFLSIKGSPQWFTVTGGSQTYVSKVAAAIGDVRLSLGACSVTRTGEGVELLDAVGDIHHFDKVVIATHADQALALLADPSPAEKRVLNAFEYSHNMTVLHRDDHTAVTYWMNRLQGIESAEPFLVTLNANERIDPATVVATMHYTHPIYTTESVAAQSGLKTLASESTAYAGAYHGWGFHEDGCRSGVRAAQAFGVAW